jgi:SAM-dependent methyltransferase
MDDNELKRRFYPESNLSGFSHVDGTVGFYTQIAAFLRPTDTVLDFGAGRGEVLAEDNVAYRRDMCDLRPRCGHLDGCDIDPAVLENSYLDEARVINYGEPLPYDDNRFDVVIARYVFEHVENPDFTARELLRVLKPGGIIDDTTANKRGNICVNARMVPSRYHVAVLARSQPERKAEDVFPTQYKLNTRRDLEAAFGAHAEVFVVRRAPEPAYHFGRPWLFRFIKGIDKHTPDAFLPVLDVFVRKRG